MPRLKRALELAHAWGEAPSDTETMHLVLEDDRVHEVCSQMYRAAEPEPQIAVAAGCGPLVTISFAGDLLGFSLYNDNVLYYRYAFVHLCMIVSQFATNLSQVSIRSVTSNPVNICKHQYTNHVRYHGTPLL